MSSAKDYECCVAKPLSLAADDALVASPWLCCCPIFRRQSSICRFVCFKRRGCVGRHPSLPMQNAFVKSFFFSIHTFGTIGYGTISPVGTTANVLVIIESIISFLLQALVTGMFFARFSRPVPRIEFSHNAVIAPYRNRKGLMFRLATFRTSQLIDVEAKVFFVRVAEEK